MIPSGVEIFLGLEPIDLRWGFERLAGIVSEQLGLVARSGALYVFIGKRRSAMKILYFDGTGMCVFYKRLDRNTFRIPEGQRPDTMSVELSARELDDLLDGVAVEVEPPSASATALAKISSHRAQTAGHGTRMCHESAVLRGTEAESQQTSASELRAQFEAERAMYAQRIAELEQERDRLRASYERLREELELFKRRLFVAKAERIDTTQLQFEYAEKLKELDTIAGTLGLAKGDPDDGDDTKARDGKRRGKRKNNVGTGRRDLRSVPVVEEERIELADAHLEKLVAEGKVKRHGFEETVKIGHKRGGKRRIIIARVRYKTVDAEGNADVITTAMPGEILPGAIAAPSLVAHVIMENIGKGLPLFRIEDTFAREGLPIDRATLARWKKRTGDTLADTVVSAMNTHALQTAFCMSTDATGVCIQPIANDRQRQPCKKGHFLVRIADRDHILFDYLERETSKAIYHRFRGFQGYVQADAKSVFNLLFADDAAVRGVVPRCRARRLQSARGRVLVSLPPAVLGSRRCEERRRSRGADPNLPHLRARCVVAQEASQRDQAAATAAPEASRRRFLRVGRRTTSAVCSAARVCAHRARVRTQPAGSVDPLLRRRPSGADQQRRRARHQIRGARPQGLALLRQRRPRQKHRRAVLDRFLGAAARHRARGIPALPHSPRAALAARPHARALSALLEADSGSASIPRSWPRNSARSPSRSSRSTRVARRKSRFRPPDNVAATPLA